MGRRRKYNYGLIKDMIREGYAYSLIADEIGCSYGTVYAIARRMDVPGLDREQDDALLALISELGTRWGVNPVLIARRALDLARESFPGIDG